MPGDTAQGQLDGFGPKPVDACAYYEQCLGRTPGGVESGNSLCPDCLDAARYRDSSLPDPRESA